MRKLLALNPVALVTGGSRGIGRACALRLADDGYDVCVTYLQGQVAAQQVARRIRSLGRRSLALQCDVAREADVKRIVGKCLRDLGRIDVLVANAGVSAIKHYEDISSQEWDRMVSVNLKGTFFCIREVARAMKRRRSGSIVVMSSQAGITGGVFIGIHYSVAKAGLICLVRHMARQLARFGVRVNCVAPGLIATEMSDRYPSELKRGMVASVPLGRIGTAEEVADAVRFIAGDAGRYITGATLHVNGGQLMM
jgi:3-oxoacyl-[acyl-carrier protein] reductase